jgi:hypothetical protein
MKNFFYLGLLLYLIASCRKVEKVETETNSNKLEGYWQLKSFTVDPPLVGTLSNLTPFLDPCATKVTFYFRDNGTTTFVDVPEVCKGDLEGINLNTDAISKWKFEGEKLIIFNDYSTQKDEYEFQKKEDTMIWKRKQVVTLPTALGGNQTVGLILTFTRRK